MQKKMVHEYFEGMPMTKNEIYSLLNVFKYFFHSFIIFVVAHGEPKL